MRAWQVHDAGEPRNDRQFFVYSNRGKPATTSV
jgi:hypothetical protein